MSEKGVTFATPGMEPLVLLAFSIQRLARVIEDRIEADLRPGARETLRQVRGDTMLVLEAAGLVLPPKLQAVADERRRERRSE